MDLWLDHTKMHEGKPKPCGFPSELADIMFTVLALAGHLNIDLEEVMALKWEYNKNRPLRGGHKEAIMCQNNRCESYRYLGTCLTLAKRVINPDGGCKGFSEDDCPF